MSVAITKLVDVIPTNDSGETGQSSEPSLAVNPTNTSQIITGAFGPSATLDTPYYLSTDGGTVWTSYDTLATSDKSLAWTTDGTSILTSTLTSSSDVATYSGTTSSSGFGTPINTYAPQTPDDLDQPWIRTGPSDHVYVAYNNLNNIGKTASVNVSTDGGKTYTAYVIDPVGGSASGAQQDDPAVRVAVNGSTAYAVYMRWNTTVENDSNGQRYASDVVVVRSDNGGADGFTALGSGGDGAEVAATTATFTDTETNTPLTLGQERIAGGDLALAIDPSNTDHLVVAYPDAPGANGSGKVQIIGAESTDGGATWATKYTSSSSVRSAQPAISIASDGTIGLLYDSYDPTANKLSQHLLTTSDDFATTGDTLLATESNLTPTSKFEPYLGDFFD